MTVTNPKIYHDKKTPLNTKKNSNPKHPSKNLDNPKRKKH